MLTLQPGYLNMCEMLQVVAYCSAGFLTILTILTIVASRETIRYYTKFFFFLAVTAIPSSLHIPFMLLRIRDPRNAIPIAWYLNITAKILNMTLYTRGEENIVKNSGSIVLINHQSILDLCVLGKLWLLLKRCTVIAKKEILYFGLFGLAAWLWGTIFIDRQKNKEACNIINEAAKSIKDLKANLLIFPEGSRYSNSTLMTFKKGAFHLAIATQLPIQPVVVSKYYFLNSKLKIFNSGSSYITILPPIPTEGLTIDDLPKLMENVYEIMNKTFIETSEEMLNEHINDLKSNS